MAEDRLAALPVVGLQYQADLSEALVLLVAVPLEVQLLFPAGRSAAQADRSEALRQARAWAAWAEAFLPLREFLRGN